MFAKETKERMKANILTAIVAIVLFVLLSNLAAVLASVKGFMAILTPFFIGLCIAFVLNVLMKILENKVFFKMADSKKKWVNKLRRPLCLLLSYVIALSIISGITAFIIPEFISSVKSLTDNIPSYLASLQQTIVDLLDKFGASGNLVETLTSQWTKILTNGVKIVGNVVPQVFTVTMGITSGVINAFIGIIISIYMLSSKERLIRNMKKFLFAFFPEKFSIGTLHVFKTANKYFSAFVSGQITEAFVLGTMCFIGMSIFGFKYALLISVTIAFSSLIPIFGALLGAIPSAFILLIISPWQALWFIIFLIVLQQIEGNLVYPRVVGTSIGLSGIWVMFAVIVCGSLAGVVGILIGIPTFATVYALMREAINRNLRGRSIQVE